MKWFFYRISVLMLPTLTQRYDKKSFHFKNKTLIEINRLSRATFYDCLNTIYQFIKSFLENEMSVFKEYGSFEHVISYASSVLQMIHMKCQA